MKHGDLCRVGDLIRGDATRNSVSAHSNGVVCGCAVGGQDNEQFSLETLFHSKEPTTGTMTCILASPMLPFWGSGFLLVDVLHIASKHSGTECCWRPISLLQSALTLQDLFQHMCTAVQPHVCTLHCVQAGLWFQGADIIKTIAGVAKLDLTQSSVVINDIQICRLS